MKKPSILKVRKIPDVIGTSHELKQQVLRSVRLLAVILLAGNCRMGDDQNSL